MTTALDIIEGGLRYIGVKSDEQELSAEEAQGALVTLNDIGLAWSVNHGVSYEYLNLVSDEMTTPPFIDNAFKTELAIREAASLNIAPSILLIAMHDEAIRLMLSTHINLDVQYPDSLPMGSSQGDTYYDQSHFPVNEKENF